MARQAAPTSLSIASVIKRYLFVLFETWFCWQLHLTLTRQKISFREREAGAL